MHHVDFPTVNDAGKKTSMGALAQPSTELTEMSHKHCADLLASLVVSQLTSVVVMSSTTLNQSVTKILAKDHNINREDALPEIIRFPRSRTNYR